MKVLPTVSITALAAAALFFSLSMPSRSTSLAQPMLRPNAQGTAMLERLPVAFVPNHGQWQHSARFVARIGAMTVFLEEKGWTFTLVERTTEKKNDNLPARGVAVRMTFPGASTPHLVAEEVLPGRHNYFLGNDPSKWRSDVPLYRAVRYREVHPGIDVRAREQDGHFEYDLVLQPSAELEPVEIAVEGIERMHLDRDGTLVLETRLGPVRMPAPLSWEEGPSGERSPITCRYVVRGEDRFGFEVTGRRSGWTLVLDPGLLWSTFLGGMSGDRVDALVLDAQGVVTTIAGATGSADFPTTLGAFDTSYNGGTIYGGDAFVTRLSPTGSSLVYSTFLGGTDDDYAQGLALDAQGGATVTGWTVSTDFPTTSGAYDTTYNGVADTFVTRLSPTGSILVYSTLIGGTGNDYAFALALDTQGAVIVAGETRSADFPTTPGAFDTTYNFGPGDAFVTRLSPTGSILVYSTFLGGRENESANALTLDVQGAATVAGYTWSTDFPTTPGAFDTSYSGGHRDVFVTRLSPTGSTLVYSTFLGGTAQDDANALALDAQGAATVAGETRSTDFPTTPGAFDTTHNGFADAFVTRLSPMGSNLAYSTFLGGTDLDGADAVALDAQGAATLAGFTYSATFPTTPGAWDTSYNGGLYDAFVTRLSPTGSSLVYSTFLGGTDNDYALALALDAQSAATVAGATRSTDFPTKPGAFDTSYNGGFWDAFVTRLDMLPTGVSAFGRSSPGCTGALAISVTSMPRVGNASFALTCGNAPVSTAGLLAFTGGGFQTPAVVLGVEVWIDPSQLFVPLSVSSNNIGAADVQLSIPNDSALAGLRLFAQFLWGGPASPPPCPPLGFSASNALDITIQP